MFTGRTHRLPLLPFERQIIELIGCTEEEYRRFAQEAEWRSRVRPAGYEHIPEVQAGFVVPVLISLAVGLATSAVSYLLTPKPKDPGRTRERRLANRTGAERFSSTSGFDTQADLANYGDPIPIIFGQYTGATGGILAAPRLVWSRAFSLGSQQAVKLLLIVGEQGLDEGIRWPDLNGIFLGNTALDAIYQHDFAFYWKGNSNRFFRIRASNLTYGTRGGGSSGDVENNDDIFLCPTRNALLDTGFCNAYSLAANTQFGVYSAIPNGTNYRVNWRTIAIPNLPDQDDDPGSALLADRIKISGDYGFDATTKDGRNSIRNAGQKGIGRNYGRFMGLTTLNGYTPTAPTEARSVAVGDFAVYTIAPGALRRDLYYLSPDFKNVQVDDINSETESNRRAADDMLQIGETVMIGRTVWLVSARRIPIWKQDLRQEITLKCIEVPASGPARQIGLISEQMLTRGVYSDDGGTTNANNGLGFNSGAGFYPVTRVSFGVVRNTRPCDVTEIGLKSQVWQRVSGLCNFSSLPSPSDLIKSESKRVSILSGTMTLYMKRTSCWTMWLRPAGTDNNGAEYAWVPIGEQFCVTGETPQDQFNFIRIKHPNQQQYEFRMIPKSGADITRHDLDDAVFWRLDAKQGSSLAGSYATPYGTFDLYSLGQYVAVKGLRFNAEMLTNAEFNDGSTQSSIPLALAIEKYFPDVEGTTARAASVSFIAWLPDAVLEGRAVATLWELFGNATTLNQTKTVRRVVSLSATVNVEIEFTGIANVTFSSSHPYFPNQLGWNLQSLKVVSSTGGFSTGQNFDYIIPVTAGNPRAQPYGLTTCGLRMNVTSTSAGQPVGRSSAYAYELLGSAMNYSIGYTATTTFIVTSTTGGTARIIVSGRVIATTTEVLTNFPTQTKNWSISFSVDQLATYGTWAVGATMDHTRVASQSNPFYQPDSSVGVRLRVMSLQNVVLPPGYLAERAFEEHSQVADISLYGSLMQKSNESSPEHEIVYVNEMVANDDVPRYEQLTLCGLSLKASRNFTSLDQMRVWLANGISVKKFEPGATGLIGPSNKFTDLVYFLLTDKVAGAGAVVSPSLIKTEDFPATAQFLKQNKLFFDGAIDQPTNLRQFISDTAPFFLCNFVIADGKFSLVPAVPANSSGSISTNPVEIKQLFTSGNIIEGSFRVEYLAAEERKDFQAVMRFRRERRNQLPEEQTLVVRWAEANSNQHSIENFDMTQYCTSREHALLVAKYFLSIRRRVTHSVRFQTTPYGLNLAPGDYIKVATQASPYSAANNGVIDASGVITSATELADGNYTITYWRQTDVETRTATLTVAGGKAIESDLWNALFTISNVSTSNNVYMIEQLTLNEEGMVEIAATEFPCTTADSSLIALDLVSGGSFLTEG